MSNNKRNTSIDVKEFVESTFKEVEAFFDPSAITVLEEEDIMSHNDDSQQLREHWERILKQADEEFQNLEEAQTPDFLLHKVDTLRALALVRCGISCSSCHGYGTRTYGSTSTWGSGCGGQAMTEGVCDTCWGTGRTDKIGTDLRKLKALTKDGNSCKDIKEAASNNTGGKVKIQYTNWKGVEGIRRILPIKVIYGSNEYHQADQWLLIAHDLDKDAERTFAVCDIHEWEDDNS